jgi:hypothetical protein
LYIPERRGVCGGERGEAVAAAERHFIIISFPFNSFFFDCGRKEGRKDRFTTAS